MNELIQNSKRILEPAAAPKGIMSYESQNIKFRNGLKEKGLSCPKFKLGLIDKNQLNMLLEKLHCKESLHQVKQQIYIKQ